MMLENKFLPSSSVLTPFDGVKKDINPNEITHSLYNKIYFNIIRLILMRMHDLKNIIYLYIHM